MASFNNNDLEETMQETQEKIQQKQYAYNFAENEYLKLFDQSEKYAKNIDVIRERKQQCENMVKACYNRLSKVEKTEKDFEKEIIKNKKLVSDLKLNLLEIEKEQLEMEKQFGQVVKQLVEKLCNEREVFCKNVLSEEIQNSYDENNAYDQEIKDLRQSFSEIRSQCPEFISIHEKTIKSCLKQVPLIKRETDKQRFENILFENKKVIYEQRKSSALKEIMKIEEQL